MIKLVGLRVINWYAYNNVTVPVNTFTLIAGKNGNGKSALLDALKYGLFGDTVFNKSSENKGSRTVSSYTRGLLDATAGTYMRPVSQYTFVYTHIVMEFLDEEMQRSFLLGTVIDTDSGNNTTTRRYVLENTKLANFSNTYEAPDGRLMPYSSGMLQKELGIRMLDAREGLLKFSQMIGLRMGDQQLAVYRRKLRNIMSYDPEAKIDRFIRESVLEEKNIDFTKLREAKRNIDTLGSSFGKIDQEIKELDGIIQCYRDYNEAVKQIVKDDIKRTYIPLIEYRDKNRDAKSREETAARRMADIQEKRKELTEKEGELQKEYSEAKEQLRSLDCARAIESAEQDLYEQMAMLDVCKGNRKLLERWQEKINEVTQWADDNGLEFDGREVLQYLQSGEYSASTKELAVNKLVAALKEKRDSLIVAADRLRTKKKDNLQAQSKLQMSVDGYINHKTTFDEIPDYIHLRDEINKEFVRKFIRSEAKLACEYVIGLANEAWRDSIESYLGAKRYTILVEPEYFRIAEQVFARTEYRHAHLCNTELLMKKDYTPLSDAVSRQINIRNPVARKYFDYYLGHFHAASVDTVSDFEFAMTQGGRVSSGLDCYYMDFNRLKIYYLGLDSIEINRIKLERQITALKEQYKELSDKAEDAADSVKYIDAFTSVVRRYDYNVNEEYRELTAAVNKSKAYLTKLKNAQTGNQQYNGLSEKKEQLYKEIEKITREREVLTQEYYEMKAEETSASATFLETTKRMSDISATLDKFKADNPIAYNSAIAEYTGYLSSGKTGPGGPLKTREKAVAKMNALRQNVTVAQASYNARRPESAALPQTLDTIVPYEARRAKIWTDDLQEIKERLNEYTKRYEEIFKNEFVLTIYQLCESAKEDLRLINSELRGLKFKSIYEFEVKDVRGGDFEAILKYAGYLKKKMQTGIPQTAGEGSRTAAAIDDEEGARLEKRLNAIIAKITDSSDQSLLEQYADYRNYMTYDILLTNDVLKKAKLSRQSGYNSGAEIQIPYLLILLSALLLIYNDKLNSLRICMIDEPFAKMDPVNTKIMMSFMRSQNLQMIFCAPDKTDVIGSESDVILPVLRVKPDLMEVGAIEFHNV